MLDHTAGFNAAVGGDEGLGAPQVVFGLGDCTGYHADMELGLGLGEHISSGEDEGQRQQYGGELRKLFHKTSC